MLDNQVISKNNKTKEQILKIKEFSKQTVFPWLFAALTDWTVMILAMFLCILVHSVIIYFLAAVVIGNRQHALAILGHDGAHFTVHSNRSWNDFLSNLLCFWPLLITTEGYRKLHFIHHNNTGTSKDPELLHKKARAPQWNLPLNKRKILLYSFADIFGYSLPDLFIILTFSKPEKRVYFLPVILMHFSFLAASVYSGYWVLPLMWYGSLASTFMMFFRLRLWIEHQGTYGTQRIVLHPVQGMIFSPHKAWYHWEHHLFPTVPYHKLEKAREILNGPSPISLSQLLYKLMNSHPLPSGAMVDDPANLSVQN